MDFEWVAIAGRCDRILHASKVFNMEEKKRQNKLGLKKTMSYKGLNFKLSRIRSAFAEDIPLQVLGINLEIN